MNFAKMVNTLSRDEGVELKLYRDTTGHWTIGVGRNLEAHGISNDEAMFMLSNDIDAHWGELVKALPWVANLDEPRQHVLLNMAFNMGVPTLLTFRNTLDLVRSKDYKAAASAMLMSKWADQVKGRAVRLSVQMETGVES